MEDEAERARPAENDGSAKDEKPAKGKKKPRPPRQAMPEQSPRRRSHNFEEVPKGYTPEIAMVEASRCLSCKKPLCVLGCPVNIDIPAFVSLITEGKFIEAALKLSEETALPAVCGRVCPQESQCEKVCVLGKKFEPVAIGRLERFAADYARTYGNIPQAELPKPSGKKVAVIGAGPAGITVAGDLARLGHKVVVYEALHLPGGVLMYGIPEFRLPKHIVQYEINNLKELGVELHTDYVIGKTETVDQLILDQGFDAVFIGAGAGLPMFLDIPGENAIGVYSANEFLTRINLMKAYEFPHYATSPIRAKHVITVGGGNVAMDSARCALRLGAKSTVVYRRAREQMPARNEEIHHAEEEGVVFNFLTNPERIITDDCNHAVGMECLRMELGEPDASGRRRPVAIDGSNFSIEADVVVVAIGNKPNPLIPQTSPELKTTRWGTIAVDEKTMATDREGVFAGGDVVSGAATVISAMGQGKIAAKSMDYYLRTGEIPRPQPEPKVEDKQQPAESQKTIGAG